jgi:hypothetical protein
VNLDPPRYECPVHHVDLTALVEQRLREDEDSDLAFGNRGVLRGLVGRGREPGSASTRPFQVVVPCAGGDPPHVQVCEGSYVP